MAAHGLDDLSGRVAKGASWIAAARVAANLLGFVSMIVVARLLAPEDFGVIAVAVTAMQLVQGLSDIGVSQAVIRFRDADREDLDTLFTLSALRGLLVALLLVASAPLLADFFRDERIVSAMFGAALYPLFMGFVNPRFFEFERALDYSKEFVWTVASKVVSVGVAIAVAVLFRNFWAILLGTASLALVQLVLSYWMRPYRPRISFASFGKIVAFSGWLAGVGLLAAINNKVDAFIFARILGPAPTGNLYYGFLLSEMPTREFSTPVARAIYPGLSELQDDHEGMRSAFLRGVEALGAIAMPASLGFAFVARDFIMLLLSEKWSEAAPVVEIMTPILGVQTLFLATQYFAMAQGRTQLVFMRELIYGAVRFPIIIFGALQYGFMGAIWASALTGLVHVALNLWVYAVTSGRSAFEPLVVARRSLLAGAAMAGYFLFLRPEVSAFSALPPALRLATDIGVGGAIYIVALLLAWRLEGRPDGVERQAISLFRSRAAALRRI